MKILLVGEYSRLHNSLKEGLLELGHDCQIIADGDHFKDFSTDFTFRPTLFSNYWLLRKTNNALNKLFAINLEKLERGLRFYFLIPKLENFDQVQLINSDAIQTYPFLSRFLYKKLFRKIKNRTLLICGDETPVIDYLLKKEFQYSILSPYFEDSTLEKHFEYPLKYTQKNYRKTFDWLAQNCQNIITSDLDYKIPLEAMKYNVNFIPNPINIDKIDFKELEIDLKVIIFLGINRGSYIKKGIPFFEKALHIIKEKYGDKVEIIISENIPYSQYIQLYNKAHILLDQIYAYDQGYNALEAMAQGKVVFTGAETEFLNHYLLNENEVAINAIPDVNDLVEKVSLLIENPQTISRIGKNARSFIEREHDYLKIASKYIDIWMKKT